MQGTRVGTPLYLSPELIKQQPYNCKVDVWATGCVLYHIACLEPPFVGENLIALGNSIVFKEPKDLPSIYTTQLRGFIKKLMSKKAASRPSAGEMVKLIPTLLKKEGIAETGTYEETTLATNERTAFKLPDKSHAQRKCKRDLPLVYKWPCKLRNRDNVVSVASSVMLEEHLAVSKCAVKAKGAAREKKSEGSVNVSCVACKKTDLVAKSPSRKKELIVNSNSPSERYTTVKRVLDNPIHNDIAPKHDLDTDKITKERCKSPVILSARKQKPEDFPYKDPKNASCAGKGFNNATSYKSCYNPIIFYCKPSDSFSNRNRPTLSSLRNIYTNPVTATRDGGTSQRPVSAIPVQRENKIIADSNGEIVYANVVNKRPRSAVPRCKASAFPRIGGAKSAFRA
eukprot:TRINITY_DN10646_c0_g7_i1.p1 TRINITY_DN10646_c0_g7~~TRINITY_DN10646_c0_g7_i1.p1  ORF type:complete len:398 (-),score=66.33 TRINITY_DN10646_c0_g7_i1:815-2008(-)